MMTRILMTFLVGMTISCSSQPEGKESIALRSDHAASLELIAKIDSLEAELKKENFELESNTTTILLESYSKYVDLYPGNTAKCPEYLYKSAALYRSVSLPLKAIKQYQIILNEYPGYKLSSEVAFQIAFTYDNDLNEKQIAQEAYEEVIAKFPDDLWANQSKERLKTLHMTDDELIKTLMEKNKID